MRKVLTERRGAADEVDDKGKRFGQEIGRGKNFEQEKLGKVENGS
jgi:hypothetical protein